MQKAFKFKLEPTVEQEKILFEWLSHLRGLFNLALEHRILNYQQFRKSMNYYDQANELPELKKVATWLEEVPSQCLQQKLKDVESAYKKFFSQGSGFPKFKKRGEGESARFPDPKKFKVSFRNGKRTSFVKLPKIGSVRFVSSREIEGQIKNATITKRVDGYYISFQTEIETTVFQTRRNPIGIDRGVRTMSMTSDGECLEIPLEKIRLLEENLRRAQKSLSRKSNGSKNRSKHRIRVAKIHQKITNVRNDSLHKISTQLAKSHGMIVLEDLKVKNMSASAKGTPEEPGKKVKQKSGLNRSIIRQGWGELERQLAYKLLWSGGELIKVKPHFTSQACNQCGHIEKTNRSKENFACRSCGHKDHADINAAKNILALGHRATVCGEVSFGATNKLAARKTSLKQKPKSA